LESGILDSLLKSSAFAVEAIDVMAWASGVASTRISRASRRRPIEQAENVVFDFG
jgi:hypothetical protein